MNRGSARPDFHTPRDFWDIWCRFPPKHSWFFGGSGSGGSLLLDNWKASPSQIFTSWARRLLVVRTLARAMKKILRQGGASRRSLFVSFCVSLVVVLLVVPLRVHHRHSYCARFATTAAHPIAWGDTCEAIVSRRSNSQADLFGMFHGCNSVSVRVPMWVVLLAVLQSLANGFWLYMEDLSVRSYDSEIWTTSQNCSTTTRPIDNDFTNVRTHCVLPAFIRNIWNTCQVSMLETLVKRILSYILNMAKFSKDYLESNGISGVGGRGGGGGQRNLWIFAFCKNLMDLYPPSHALQPYGTTTCNCPGRLPPPGPHGLVFIDFRISHIISPIPFRISYFTFLISQLICPSCHVSFPICSLSLHICHFSVPTSHLSVHICHLSLGHVLDTCWTLIGHFWDTCWRPCEDLWDTCSTLVGHLRDTFWTIGRHLLSVFFVNTCRMFGEHFLVYSLNTLLDKSINQCER